MVLRHLLRSFVSVLLALSCIGGVRGEPFPVDQAAETKILHETWQLSPDGAWLARGYVDPATSRGRLEVEELATGRRIELRSSESSLEPIWSPDSRRLAYGVEENGVPALWIWERGSRTERRIAAARPVLFFKPQWFPDSRRLLLPLWPEGEAPAPKDAETKATNLVRPPFKRVAGDKASVYVLSAHMQPESEAGGEAGDVPGDAAVTKRCNGKLIHGRCDLGVVNVDDGSVGRLATRIHLAWFFMPSPDSRQVAYTLLTGLDPDNQDQLYELHMLDPATGRDRVLAGSLRLYGGKNVSWSPDGRRLAWSALRTGDTGRNRLQTGQGEVGTVALDDGQVMLSQPQDSGGLNYRHAPVWSDDAKTLYALGTDGKVRRIDASRGDHKVVVDIPGFRIVEVVAGKGDRLLASAISAEDGAVVRLYGVDPATASTQQLCEGQVRIVPGTLRLGTDGRITLQASSARHLPSVWQLDPATGRLRAVGASQDRFAKYGLGEARLISWQTADGQTLRGKLLLPPNYRPGTRAPMVVWAYGGNMNSQEINESGLDAGAFNFHVLASRGYAVLSPDAPLRVGRTLQDIMLTVMPGVDAAIAQGYADPDRLAVMGHSFGAFSTLALITQTPRFKAAVISGVGHPDLVAGYLKMQPDGASNEGYYENGQQHMGGTPWEYPQRYRDNSTIHRFDRISTPVLIGQGEADGTTPMSGANAVFVALRRLGKPVEYRIYEGEGHGLYRKAHIVDFWNRRLEFLAEHLDLTLDGTGAVAFEKGRTKSRAPKRNSGTGYQRTASGLKYWVIRRGTGPRLQPGKIAVVHLRTTRTRDGLVVYDGPVGFVFTREYPNPVLAEAATYLRNVGDRATVVTPPGRRPDKAEYRDEVEVLSIKDYTLVVVLRDLIETAGVEAAQRRFEELRKAHFAGAWIEEKEHLSHGRSLLRQDNTAGAIAMSRWATELFPDSAAPHVHLGNALFRGGEQALAIASYRKALELDPVNAAAREALDGLVR